MNKRKLKKKLKKEGLSVNKKGGYLNGDNY